MPLAVIAVCRSRVRSWSWGLRCHSRESISQASATSSNHASETAMNRPPASDNRGFQVGVGSPDSRTDLRARASATERTPSPISSGPPSAARCHDRSAGPARGTTGPGWPGLAAPRPRWWPAPRPVPSCVARSRVRHERSGPAASGRAWLRAADRCVPPVLVRRSARRSRRHVVRCSGEACSRCSASRHPHQHLNLPPGGQLAPPSPAAPGSLRTNGTFARMVLTRVPFVRAVGVG
jgi:hypothetical protein